MSNIGTFIILVKTEKWSMEDHLTIKCLMMSSVKNISEDGEVVKY